MTLIEVLIALFVISMALTAVTGAVTGVIRNTSRLEDKLYGHWILQNEFNKIVLQMGRERIGVGENPIGATMGGRPFEGRIKTETTPITGVFLLEGEVTRHGRVVERDLLYVSP